MNEPVFILKGNVVYSKNKDELRILKDHYLISESGLVKGVFEKVPPEYAQVSVSDYGECLIIPGLTDLHVHAPQYTFRAMGMDMELLEWLETNTFPEEAKYQDLEYARRAYRIFTDNLKRSVTTRACIFGTIHRDATLLLMDQLEQSGLVTYVGKVNMDRNCPDYLREESAEESGIQTVGDKYSVFFHSLPLFFSGIHTVRHYGFAVCPKQSKSVISIPVKLRPWAKLLHPGNLSRIF